MTIGRLPPPTAAPLAGFSRRAGRSRGTWLVASAAVLVFTLVFATWFRAGWFYATGDLGLFLRRGAFQEWRSSWTHENSGAGGAAYTIVRLPELALVRLARSLGGGEPLAERFLFSSMFAFAAAGGAALVRRFCHHGTLIVGGGFLAAFNLLALTGLPNYLPILVVGVIGLLTARAIDVARGTPVRITGLVACTLPMSYVSLNPPLMAVVAVWTAMLPVIAPALTATGRPGRWRTLKALAAAAPVALAVHLWWVVPQVLAIGRARATDTIGAQTDVAAWAWTHKNNSLANVMTLRSAWTWPDPASHGLSATVLGRPSVAWLAWLLPAGICIAALFATAHRRLVHLLSIGCVACWIVGKGLHEPASFINAALYNHVPGFWLLREPMSKVGAVPLLAMVLCWAIALEALMAQTRPRYKILPHTARTAMTALLCVGPLLFAWPMASGQVTKDDQPGRHEQVQLPAGWTELADAVNDAPTSGKVLVLPLVDFYQIPTTWGFYGTDTLIRGLLDRPVAARNPQGYLTDLPGYDQLLRTTETAVLSGWTDAVEPLLRTLGASHVIVRHDIDRASPIRAVDMADSVALERGLDTVAQLTKQVNNDMGSLYQLDSAVPPVQTLSHLVTFNEWADQTKLAAAMATIGTMADAALTDDTDATASGMLWAGVVDGSDTLHLPKATTALATRTNTPTLPYRLALQRSSGNTTELHAVEANPPAIGMQVLTPRVAGRWNLGPAQLLGVDVDGVLAPIGDGQPDPVLPIGPRSIVRAIVADSGPTLNPFGPLGDCFRYDDRTADQVGLGSTETDDGHGIVMRLQASDHRACRTAELLGANPGTTYRLIQKLRSIEGAAPEVCLWIDGPQQCLPLPAPGPPDHDGWQTIDATFTIPLDVTGAHLYLYANSPTDGEPRTTTEYRIPRLVRGQAGKGLPLAPSSTQTQTVALDAGSHVLNTPGVTASLPNPWSELGDCHRTDQRSFNELGLRATIHRDQPDTVQLSAREHSACVHSALPPLLLDTTYTISLPYRAVQGAQARVCAFDTIKGRCLPLTGDIAGGRLPASSGWATAQLRMQATGNPLDFYVYSDGVSASTVIDYRLPNLRPAHAEVVTVLSYAADKSTNEITPPTAPTTEPATPLSWTSDGPNHRAAQVQAVQPGLIVATTEAFDPGWILEGVPSTVNVQHTKLDGYRNGWILDRAGTFNLTFRYRPDRTAHRAQRFSLIAAILLALHATTRHVRRPAPRPNPPTRAPATTGRVAPPSPPPPSVDPTSGKWPRLPPYDGEARLC